MAPVPQLHSFVSYLGAQCQHCMLRSVSTALHVKRLSPDCDPLISLQPALLKNASALVSNPEICSMYVGCSPISWSVACDLPPPRELSRPGGWQVDPLVSLMKVEKVPDSTYDMVGGLDQQIKEIKEVGALLWCMAACLMLHIHDWPWVFAITLSLFLCAATAESHKLVACSLQTLPAAIEAEIVTDCPTLLARELWLLQAMP